MISSPPTWPISWPAGPLPLRGLLLEQTIRLARRRPSDFAEFCFADAAGLPLRQAVLHRNLQDFLTAHAHALVEVPRERLEARRQEIGATAFARGYRLVWVPDEEVPIRAEWVKFWTDATQVHAGQQELFDERTTFPFGEHDDLLDAAATGAAHLLDRREPRVW